jgi:hypothetical protein
VEGSLEKAKRNVEANITRGMANLHEKILSVQKERDLLYHTTGPAAADAPSVRLP